MLNFCCQIPNEAKMRKKHKSYLIHFPGVISAPSLETYLEGRRQLLENEMQLRNFFLPFFSYTLKELYTSISTLAQKLVLTLLNNEFTLEILISTPFGRKIRERFRLKKHKSQISS